MTDLIREDRYGHPAHNLVSWPAVLVGGVVAVATGAMLNLLGVALGAAAFNPYDLSANDASQFSAAAGLWMAVANGAALFVGGMVASRAAKYGDHHRGALHGLTVWGLAFLLALILATASAAGGAAAVAGGEAADPTAGNAVATDILVDPTTGARSRVVAGDVAAPVITPANPAVAEEAAEATATLALWAFLTMAFGAAAAIFGGMYGTRNHRWMNRAGLSDTHDHGRVAPATADPVASDHKVYPTPRS